MKLFVRGLTVIDSSYLDPIRGFVGESFQVDVILDGEINDQSMILDFSLVKKQIKKIIDFEVDHKLLVPVSHKNCTVSKGELNTRVDFLLNDQAVIQLKCPNEAFCLLDTDIINIQLLEIYLKDKILKQLPQNITNLEIKLNHEIIDTPFYHYTHGLKKHSGNCQRIAHGHRSKLEIFINNKYDDKLVQQWAKRWEDIYLVSLDDLIESSSLTFEPIENNVQNTYIAYESEQGRFELLLPNSYCEIIKTDTTVEELALFICQEVKLNHLNDDVTVYAYEGIGKGAIAQL